MPDCDKRQFGRGLCNTHYMRQRRTGDPAGLRRPAPQKNPPALCTVSDCGKPHRAFGLCHAHYTRRRRHGDPVGGNTGRGVPLRWLRDHVEHAGDDCLTWPYATGGTGEPVVTFRGRQRSGAALMCELAHGKAPTPKHEAAHNCGMGHEACINPRHLRWATRSENSMDKHAHGTMPLGEGHVRHILTVEQVMHIRRRKEPARTLAKRYGVHIATIYAALSRTNWAWLK